MSAAALTTPSSRAASSFYELAPEWSPWLHSSGPHLQSVVTGVTRQALQAEESIPRVKRQRARRADALSVFHGIIDSLIAHVTYEYIRSGGPISVSLSKKALGRASRYLSPLQSEQLPKIIALLSSPDL